MGVVAARFNFNDQLLPPLKMSIVSLQGEVHISLGFSLGCHYSVSDLFLPGNALSPFDESIAIFS